MYNTCVYESVRTVNDERCVYTTLYKLNVQQAGITQYCVEQPDQSPRTRKILNLFLEHLEKENVNHEKAANVTVFQLIPRYGWFLAKRF